MARKVDPLLLGRYALLVALTVWIPLPLLDRGVENFLRRRLVRAIAARHGATLDDEAVRRLADTPGGGCTGCLVGVVVWPVKKLVKWLFTVLSFKDMADLASDVVHRGLLLEEALETGWLRDAGSAERVRVAMDHAIEKVDVRPVERALMGTFRDKKHDLSRVVGEATRLLRERRRGERAEALADAADQDALAGTDELSAAMNASLAAVGLVPELVQWFRAEMGAVPRIERKVDGVVEPELLPADEPTGEAHHGEPTDEARKDVEEAVEVVRRDVDVAGEDGQDHVGVGVGVDVDVDVGGVDPEKDRS